MINFNKVINRKGTYSVKWERSRQIGLPNDVLPLWVADMDFKSPKGVLRALNKRVNHGIFGYTEPDDEYFDAIINWMERRHDWHIKKEWIVLASGIVPVLNFIIQTFTNEGDGILIQRPVYHPFTQAIINNHRKLINSPLELVNNHYEINFEDFEEKIKSHDIKIFILCNPHNPIGKVYTKDELKTLGDICLRHNVLIIADEIHHDLVFKHKKHIPLASIDKKYSDICITCTAPSKTFNLGGVQVANIIIANIDIRDSFQEFLSRMELNVLNTFGIISCLTAYTTGDRWLEKLLVYIEENKQYLENYLNNKLPQIKVIKSEATYLLWLDCRELGLDHEELEKFLIHKAKLWLINGHIFGEEGNGFVRMNIACSRRILKQALKQLDHALKCQE